MTVKIKSIFNQHFTPPTANHLQTSFHIRQLCTYQSNILVLTVDKLFYFTPVNCLSFNSRDNSNSQSDVLIFDAGNVANWEAG